MATQRIQKMGRSFISESFHLQHVKGVDNWILTDGEPHGFHGNNCIEVEACDTNKENPKGEIHNSHKGNSERSHVHEATNPRIHARGSDTSKGTRGKENEGAI